MVIGVNWENEGTLLECDISPVSGAIPVAECDGDGLILERGLRHGPFQAQFFAQLQVRLLTFAIGQERRVHLGILLYLLSCLKSHAITHQS